MRTSLKTSALRREEPPEPITFEREDWALFRTVEGLQQRGGVAKEQLRRLVMKELTDNALDTGAKVRRRPNVQVGGYFVEDDGARHRRARPEEDRRACSASTGG